MSTGAGRKNDERLFAECKLDLLLPLRRYETVEAQDADSSGANIDPADGGDQRDCILLGKRVTYLRYAWLLYTDMYFAISVIKTTDEYFDCIVKAELPADIPNTTDFLASSQLTVTLDVCELVSRESERHVLGHSLGAQPSIRPQAPSPNGGATPSGYPFTPAPQPQDADSDGSLDHYVVGRSLLSVEGRSERTGVSTSGQSSRTLWHFRDVRIREPYLTYRSPFPSCSHIEMIHSAL